MYRGVTSQAAAVGRPSKALSIGLWVVQGLLFLLFAGTGVWKLVTPVPTLAAAMPWMGEVSPGFLYFTALADFAGGVGVRLQSLPVALVGDRARRREERLERSMLGDKTMQRRDVEAVGSEHTA